MSFVFNFLAPWGRLCRRGFLLGSVLLAAVAYVPLCLWMLKLPGQENALYLAYCWPIVALWLSARRFMDFGRSPLWALPAVAGPELLPSLVLAAYVVAGAAPSASAVVLMFSGSLLGALIFLLLALKKPSPGSNAYGLRKADEGRQEGGIGKVGSQARAEQENRGLRGVPSRSK
jgi:uncharacterized membrane protein YhaH (DUF805 family)